MSIRVRVITPADIPEVEEEDKPKILTPEYVREVNSGISDRISQREVANRTALAYAEKSVFD